jgi:hypothetical protein
MSVVLLGTDKFFVEKIALPKNVSCFDLSHLLTAFSDVHAKIPTNGHEQNRGIVFWINVLRFLFDYGIRIDFRLVSACHFRRILIHFSGGWPT